MTAALLYFDDETGAAQRLAQAANLVPMAIERHRFPDGELRLQLPASLPARVVLLRTLANPNEKLVELLLTARSARQLGANHLTLVAPYLAYMRQDMAFHPGEVISQRVIGGFLGDLFDAVVTVDPHLHRIAKLEEAIPKSKCAVITGAPMLADWIASHRPNALLVGPDGESEQWVALAAARHGFDHAVCHKVRHGDHAVDIAMPEMDVRGRQVVLLDDVASSGRTLARAAQMLHDAGAASVDVAVTHALFADDALDVIHAAGVGEVWSTDCIAHASNVVPMAATLAQALQPL